MPHHHYIPYEESICGSRRRYKWNRPFLSEKFASQVDKDVKTYEGKMFVEEKDGKFKLDLDVNGYKADELWISIRNGQLYIKGKHEERSKDGKYSVSRKFSRSMTLPELVESDKIKSFLQTDGRTLKIEVPLKQRSTTQPKAIQIPVSFENSTLRNTKK